MLWVFLSSDCPNEYVSAQQGGVFIAWCESICRILWIGLELPEHEKPVALEDCVGQREPNLYIVLSILSAKVNYLQKDLRGFFRQGLIGHSERDVRSKLRQHSVIRQHRKYFKTTEITPAIFSFCFDLFSLCFHIILPQIKEHIFNTSVLWQQRKLELRVAKRLVP